MGFAVVNMGYQEDKVDTFKSRKEAQDAMNQLSSRYTVTHKKV